MTSPSPSPNTYSYSAEDLKIFEDYRNLYDWQKTLYEKIMAKIMAPDGEFNTADSSKIISVIDKEGKKGKNSFVKWLCYNHPLDIARLSSGTASQLRSAVFNMGRRKCYIIDLPRTKGKSDSLADILSVIEDVKNGFVTSSMDEGDKQLMMAPPTVIVFSNTTLPLHSLSEDRWDLYTINPNLRLVRSQHLRFWRRGSTEGNGNSFKNSIKKERQGKTKKRKILVVFLVVGCLVVGYYLDQSYRAVNQILISILSDIGSMDILSESKQFIYAPLRHRKKKKRAENIKKIVKDIGIICIEAYQAFRRDRYLFGPR